MNDNPTITLHNCDCLELMRTMPDKSVDLVLTDPPYPKEYLYCYQCLSEGSRRVLRDNKYCISYAGHIYLPEVMRLLGINLTFHWICALVHHGASANVHPRRICVKYKPILIYSNGNTPEQRDGYFCDVINGSGRDKELHEWQQSPDELTRIIEYYTNPTDTIFDPFMGSGTTGCAAKLLRRSFVGCEIDPVYFKLAERRINNTEWGIFG